MDSATVAASNGYLNPGTCWLHCSTRLSPSCPQSSDIVLQISPKPRTDQQRPCGQFVRGLTVTELCLLAFNIYRKTTKPYVYLSRSSLFFSQWNEYVPGTGWVLVPGSESMARLSAHEPWNLVRDPWFPTRACYCSRSCL